MLTQGEELRHVDPFFLKITNAKESIWDLGLWGLVWVMVFGWVFFPPNNAWCRFVMLTVCDLGLKALPF